MDVNRQTPEAADDQALARERRARLVAEALSDRHAQAHWRTQRELEMLERLLVACSGAQPPTDALEDALAAVVEGGAWQGAQLWLGARTAIGLGPVTAWSDRDKDVPVELRSALEGACGDSDAFRRAVETREPVVVDLRSDGAWLPAGVAPSSEALVVAVVVPLGGPGTDDVLALFGPEPADGREQAVETVVRLAVHLGRAARHLLADAERESHLVALRLEAAHLGAAVVQEEDRAERAAEAFMRSLVDLGSQLREPLSELRAVLDGIAVANLADPARERVMAACEAAARLSGVLDDLADSAWDRARGTP